MPKAKKLLLSSSFGTYTYTYTDGLVLFCSTSHSWPDSSTSVVIDSLPCKTVGFTKPALANLPGIDVVAARLLKG